MKVQLYWENSIKYKAVLSVDGKIKSIFSEMFRMFRQLPVLRGNEPKNRHRWIRGKLHVTPRAQAGPTSATPMAAKQFDNKQSAFEYACNIKTKPNHRSLKTPHACTDANSVRFLANICLWGEQKETNTH